MSFCWRVSCRSSQPSAAIRDYNQRRLSYVGFPPVRYASRTGNLICYGKLAFGLIIFVGMFMAVDIAGIVGTIVPLISKSLGFDPALTSGPFETAFQDVVGISIFLSLATALIKFLLY